MSKLNEGISDKEKKENQRNNILDWVKLITKQETIKGVFSPKIDYSMFHKERLLQPSTLFV